MALQPALELASQLAPSDWSGQGKPLVKLGRQGGPGVPTTSLRDPLEGVGRAVPPTRAAPADAREHHGQRPDPPRRSPRPARFPPTLLLPGRGGRGVL